MLSVVAVVGVALHTLAGATTWEIDPAHTSVGFGVRHLMVSTVRGEFTKVSGTAEADEKDYTKAKIQATIDAASINTRVEKRDAHLKSADFLDVAKYPTITFVSTKIEKAGEGRWKVTGDLTLHGVTRPVTLDVEGPTPPVKDPMTGALRAGAHATTRINRKDFGVMWNKSLDGGGVVVGEDVDITIDVEAAQKQ
jgi:polyisoprenoid-binding protein YceI